VSGIGTAYSRAKILCSQWIRGEIKVLFDSFSFKKKNWARKISPCVKHAVADACG
jgi:hypothetical protein